ncbi:MAG TPA: PLDc_N domain-containing protein [Firmicutes bacterium]|nr:PLDc_N domain-containing protein [Candidatus Fermentithermobacillaceae bacterium]
MPLGNMPLGEMLSKFWPLMVLQVLLMVAALFDIKKRKTFRHLSRGAWIIIVILIQTLGPVAYFTLGRGEE